MIDTAIHSSLSLAGAGVRCQSEWMNQAHSLEASSSLARLK